MIYACPSSDMNFGAAMLLVIFFLEVIRFLSIMPCSQHVVYGNNTRVILSHCFIFSFDTIFSTFCWNLCCLVFTLVGGVKTPVDYVDLLLLLFER